MNAFHWKQQPSAIDFKKKAKRTRVAPTNGRPVEQLSMEGEVIDRFESMASAAESVGMQATHIFRVCNGTRRSSGGYRWRYADLRAQKVLSDKHGGAYSRAGASA